MNHFQIINKSGSSLFTKSPIAPKPQAVPERIRLEGHGGPRRFSEIFNSAEKEREISPETEESGDEEGKNQHVNDDGDHHMGTPYPPMLGADRGQIHDKTEVLDKNSSSGGEMTPVVEEAGSDLFEIIPLKASGVTDSDVAQTQTSLVTSGQPAESIKPGVVDSVMEEAEPESFKNTPVMASRLTELETTQAETPPEQTSQSPTSIKPEMMTGETERVSKTLEEISAGLLKKEKDALPGMGSKSNGGMDDGGGELKNFSMLHSSLLQSSDGVEGVHKGDSSFHSMLEPGIDSLDKGEILRQVADQMRSWRPGKNEPLRFLLEPKHLGTIKIDLLLQEKGVIARIVTADPFVKELLEGNQSFLRQGIESQGLHMQQFSVDLGDRRGFWDGKKEGSFYKGEQSRSFLSPDLNLSEALPLGLYKGRSRVNLYV